MKKKTGKTTTRKTVPKKTGKKTFGQRADEIYELKEEIKVANAKVNALKKQVKDLQIAVQKDIIEEDLGKVSGTVGRLTLVDRHGYQIVDWDKFLAFVIKSDLFHFFKRDVSKTSIDEFIAPIIDDIQEKNPKLDMEAIIVRAMRKLPGLKRNDWKDLNCGKA